MSVEALIAASLAQTSSAASLDQTSLNPQNSLQWILGIDPGKKGALACVSILGTAVCLLDMPETSDELAKFIGAHHVRIKFAVIEEVSSMTYIDASGKRRGQGAKASFTFGYGAGVLEGILKAFQIQIIYVKPATWKMLYGLSSNKDESRVLATKKFPKWTALFLRKKDDGRAEAALLALFGVERFSKIGKSP